MRPSGLLEVIGMIEQRRVPVAEADLSLVSAGATSHKFLELMAARDFERLVAALASDAHARFLLPHGLEEYDGRDAIVARIRSWFGSASLFDLAASTDDQVGMRHRISWRFNVVRDGSRQVIEQVVYLDLGPHGIERIDLRRSGFLAEPRFAGGPTQVFDAGDMGCADGLAQEFRRQTAKGSIGETLEVGASDPHVQGE